MEPLCNIKKSPILANIFDFKGLSQPWYQIFFTFCEKRKEQAEIEVRFLPQEFTETLVLNDWNQLVKHNLPVWCWNWQTPIIVEIVEYLYLYRTHFFASFCQFSVHMWNLFWTHKFGRQEIWAPTWKMEVIWSWIYP